MENMEYCEQCKKIKSSGENKGNKRQFYLEQNRLFRIVKQTEAKFLNVNSNILTT